MQQFGLSGLAVHVPPFRVNLEEWCRWTGQPWEKIHHVVGLSFRMRGPWENVYTMAASAVLRLIVNHDVDPSRVRYLALGTESSTDNSAGAVVVKGLVNEALVQHGKVPLARACEVPEFKHACLGGIYGLKGAARFLACEPDDSVAIVVASDVAEYARGSSGEPTQGAGAVAMLLDGEARLGTLDLAGCGSASDYRAVDFRKPVARTVFDDARESGHIRDFPIFNGKYSTTCYVDATLHAMRDLFQRRGVRGADYLGQLHHVLMHRPYRRMPETGLGLACLMALADGDEASRQQLAGYATAAEVDVQALVSELGASPDLLKLVLENRIGDEAYPLSMRTLKAFRSHPDWEPLVESRLQLGADAMMEIGNLYTAALPAWLAAAFEQAVRNPDQILGREWLLVGYGSGDAAEALPMTVAEQWQEAASRTGFADALRNPVDLSEAQYIQLHDYGQADGLAQPPGGFALTGLGRNRDGPLIDLGIEYYRYQS